MPRFAHISDLHIGKTDAEAPLFEQWLALLEQQPFDLLVVSGDLVDQADEPSLRWVHQKLEDFSRPYVVVPGNHDVVVPGDDALFRRYFGDYPRVERCAGMTFALFDSHNRLPVSERADSDIAMHERTGFYADGWVGDAQRADVAAMLSDDDEQRIAVVHHFLFWEPNKYHLNALLDADAMLDWLIEHDFSHVCLGHLHKPAEPRTEGGVTRLRPGRCTKAPFGGMLVDLDEESLKPVHVA